MSMVGNVEWRRERYSNPQAISGAGFQDQFNSQFCQLSARRNALTLQDSQILSRPNFLFKGQFRELASRRRFKISPAALPDSPDDGEQPECRLAKDGRPVTTWPNLDEL